MRGGYQDTYGLTVPAEGTFHAKRDLKTGITSSVERNGLVINVTYDFQQRDDAQRAYELRQQSEAPPLEHRLFDHEIAHAQDKDSDLVKEYNQTSQEAESKANAFVDKVDHEKNSMGEEEAETKVRGILGLPPKEEKKKKGKEE